jgi:2-octaprenyl-6-methoxyphenol hydroxylase
MPIDPLRIAVVGAGPVGLTLALMAAQRLPQAQVTLFDARAMEHDVSSDGRTLALSLGSVQMLQRLQVWPSTAAQAITQVHVSQVPPTLEAGPLAPEVLIDAHDVALPMLGAVLSYGALVAPLQAAWLALAATQPQRLRTAFGQAVSGLQAQGDEVQVDAAISERFDLAVVAEGGVFSEQARKAVQHDYQQTAWVGSAVLANATPGRAIERFTRQGPLALLPLPANEQGQARAALVWCVNSQDDPVQPLDTAQRMAVINHWLPTQAGQVVGLGELKRFALGLSAERTLVNGRTVRIGNAAQTLHPVAGQGMNLGLRDAFALVQALSNADSIPSALRRMEWARAPDRWATIASTDFLARTFTWAWPGAGAARGLGLAAVQWLPGVKRRVARQMMFGQR